MRFGDFETSNSPNPNNDGSGDRVTSNMVEDYIAITTRNGVRTSLERAAREARLLSLEGKERRAPYNPYLDDYPENKVWKSMRVYKKKWDDILSQRTTEKAYLAPWRFRDFPWPLFDPPVCFSRLPTEPAPYFKFLIQTRLLVKVNADRIEAFVKDQVDMIWGDSQLKDSALRNVFSQDREDVVRGWELCRNILQNPIDEQPQCVAELFWDAENVEELKALHGPLEDDPNNRGIPVEI